MAERRDGPPRVALITSAPAPYRVPAYAAAAAASGWDWHLLYCARPYIDPSISLAAPGVTSHFLPGRFVAFERRFFHADPAAWRVLSEVQPDVVITTGFIPSYLLAYAWARRHGRPHVAMTDGTLRHEAHLSAVHRALRRWVYRRSAAGIGASQASMALLQHYGLAADRCHQAPICTDNRPFAPQGAQPRPVDFLFSARFVETKQPLFALEVAHRTAERLGRPVRLRWLGAGPLEPLLRERAAERACTVPRLAPAGRAAGAVPRCPPVPLSHDLGGLGPGRQRGLCGRRAGLHHTAGRMRRGAGGGRPQRARRSAGRRGLGGRGRRPAER
jgi:glycosyltransferase involved in cell wall biosynthesis